MKKLVFTIIVLAMVFSLAAGEDTTYNEMVRIDGGSMADTITNGEIVTLDKSEYYSIWKTQRGQSNNEAERAERITYGDPKRMDVVICRYPTRGTVYFPKRIVGMPGETLEIRDGYVYIDGEMNQADAEIPGIAEEYRHGYGQNFAPYYIPQKGDRAAVHMNEREGRLSFSVNGEDWKRGQTCLVLDTYGKKMKIYDQNTDEDSRAVSVMDIKCETVVFYDGVIYLPEEFYAAFPELFDCELTIGEDYYFVLGDHRNNTNDSRNIGVLERSAIMGRIINVVFPISGWRNIE